MSAILPFQLTKTISCMLAELGGIADVEPRYMMNTTLNYKYNNQQDIVPDKTPKLGYFGIGIKGFKNLNDQNLAAPFIPSAANLDLFQPIPFRVVLVTNDLTQTERNNYRMRIQKNVNGTAYWCYYLKKLTINDVRIKILSTDITTGEETEVDSLDPNNLNPIPVDTTAEGNTAVKNKISVSLTASLQITGAEVLEAIDVLFGGDLLKSVVSEIGIYTGTDQSVSASDGQGGNFNMTESIYTQLAYHYTSLGTTFSSPSRIENVTMRISSASAFLI